MYGGMTTAGGVRTGLGVAAACLAAAGGGGQGRRCPSGSSRCWGGGRGFGLGRTVPGDLRGGLLLGGLMVAAQTEQPACSAAAAAATIACAGGVGGVVGGAGDGGGDRRRRRLGWGRGGEGGRGGGPAAVANGFAAAAIAAACAPVKGRAPNWAVAGQIAPASAMAQGQRWQAPKPAGHVCRQATRKPQRGNRRSPSAATSTIAKKGWDRGRMARCLSPAINGRRQPPCATVRVRGRTGDGKGGAPSCRERTLCMTRRHLPPIAAGVHAHGTPQADSLSQVQVIESYSVVMRCWRLAVPSSVVCLQQLAGGWQATAVAVRASACEWRKGVRLYRGPTN